MLLRGHLPLGAYYDTATKVEVSTAQIPIRRDRKNSSRGIALELEPCTPTFLCNHEAVRNINNARLY